MLSTPRIVSLAWVCLLLAAAQAQDSDVPVFDVRQRLQADADGRLQVQAWQVTAAELRNPWPAEELSGYRQRVDRTLRAFVGRAKDLSRGNLERLAMPATMAAFLAGDREQALNILARPDQEAAVDHAHTEGVDLFWSFALKPQVARWYNFADILPAQARQRLHKAIQKWSASVPVTGFDNILLLESTDAQVRDQALAQLRLLWRDAAALQVLAAQVGEDDHPIRQRFKAHVLARHAELGADPGADVQAWQRWWQEWVQEDWRVAEEYLRLVNPRPHPKYGRGSGPGGAGWIPKVRGTWVDARGGDAFRSMRYIAAYLFAEVTDNESLRLYYKARLWLLVDLWWRQGNGEWDSENLHAHILSSWANLYAYAQDDQVRAWGKAVLDLFCARAALKYHHGSWTGVGRPDYGNRRPWRLTPSTLDLYFGDDGLAAERHPVEQLYLILSQYRPPLAVRALARQLWGKGVEFHNAHPGYIGWYPWYEDRPEYHETYFCSQDFRLGSIPRGHKRNFSGCKLYLQHPQQGGQFVIPVAGVFEKLQTAEHTGQNLAQYRNLLIYVSGSADEQGETGRVPFTLLVPSNMAVSEEAGVLFLASASSWLAVHPIAQTFSGKMPWAGDPDGKHMQVAGVGTGGTLCGFAMEVGDTSMHADFATFKAAVLKQGQLDLQALDKGIVTLTGSGGKQLRLQYQAGPRQLPAVWRDGEAHDWSRHVGLLHAVGHDARTSPLSMTRGSRRLQVQAGGHVFSAVLHTDGRYECEHLDTQAPTKD